MKTLLLIGGPMGVGKTAVGQLLKTRLPNSVFLDGDWCWDSSPFYVTAETKEMVLDNIRHHLNNFLRCSAYSNVIFCWVMHEQSIIDAVLEGLDTSGCAVYAISLVASPKALEERIAADVRKGLRSPEVLPRSLGYAPLYEKLDTTKIDTTGQSAQEAAEEIERLITAHPHTRSLP